MKSSTIASPIVSNILQGARERGYNVTQILHQVGISPNILLQARARITFEQLSRLCLTLATLLGDESFGLTDRPQRPNTFKLACYSAINAATIAEAMTIFVEFMNIMEGSLAHELVARETTSAYQLRRRPAATVKNNYAIEYTLFTIHRTLCWMANARIAILKAELDYPAPDYASEYRYVFHGAPLSFDCGHSAIVFDKRAMQLQNVRDFAQLKGFLQQAPLTLLSQTIQADDLSTQLRNWLERQLTKTHHMPDIDTAADYFGLHPQALRRQLKKQGTSFQDIKMDTRRDLAINLIHSHNQSIESISAQLDFSEPSAFIRAFRTWTGLTPLAYRKLSA